MNIDMNILTEIMEKIPGLRTFLFGFAILSIALGVVLISCCKELWRNIAGVFLLPFGLWVLCNMHFSAVAKFDDLSHQVRLLQQMQGYPISIFALRDGRYRLEKIVGIEKDFSSAVVYRIIQSSGGGDPGPIFVDKIPKILAHKEGDEFRITNSLPIKTKQ